MNDNVIGMPPKDEPKKTKPRFLTYEDENGGHHVLVMQYVSGMLVTMPDNVNVVAAFLAAGGPNILVPCGRSIKLANALVSCVRVALAMDCEWDSRALDINATMESLKKRGVDKGEILVAETVLEH